MSSSPEDVPLRWVRYEDIFYPALLVPNTDAPVPVDEGNAFVYFLGAESGAVVPMKDIEPYDPNDTTRTSHPAVADGVLAAQQLLLSTANHASNEAAGQLDANELFTEAETVDGHIKTEKERRTKRKEKTRSIITHREQEEEEEQENDLLLPRSSRRRRRSHSSESSSMSSSTSSSSGEESGRGASRRRGNAHHKNNHNNNNNDDADADAYESGSSSEKDHWRTVAEDIGVDPSAAPNGFHSDLHNNTNNHNNRLSPTSRSPRVGKGAGDFSSFFTPSSASQGVGGGSIVTPFLAEIRHYYQTVHTEASEQGRLVCMQEVDLVRQVEAQLLSWRGDVLFLETALQDALSGHPSSLDEEEDMACTISAIRAELEEVRASFSVERTATALLRVWNRPERLDRNPRRGRPFGFVDAALAHLQDPRGAPALPRVLTQQQAHRYTEQWGRREQILSTQQGIGKVGFFAKQSNVMEKWRLSREILALDTRRQTQPVSRRFSQTLAKVEQHALKCLAARKGSSQFLETYHTQTMPTFYNFHDLRDDGGVGRPHQVSSSHPYMPSGMLAPDEEDEAAAVLPLPNLDSHAEAETPLAYRPPHDKSGDGFQAPLISPLHTSFDPRATFAVDAGEIQQENTLAEQLAMKSMQYSHSICLPSQETTWESSEVYDASVLAASAPYAQRRLGTSRGGSVSRRASRASSVTRDGLHAEAQTRRPRSDWRASAKRAILEQLTLYLRGLKGKPAVLSKSQFQHIAQTLLERAVRSESERTGTSMSLQTNNASTPFTREAETRLRKSVDNYVHRYFLAARTPGRESGKGKESLEHLSAAQRGQSWSKRNEEDEEVTRSVMGNRPDTTDSPVYEP